MTDTLQHFPGFLIESKATAEGIVAGLASPFGGEPDAYGDTISPGAFRDSLARHKASGTAPLMLWQHDMARPIGRWERLEERANGLWVEGRLNMATTAGSEAFAHLRSGDLSGLSIGYSVPPGGVKMTAQGRHLIKVDLAEISVVSMPAAPSARITAIKGAPVQLENKAALERLLRDAGLSRGAAEKIAGGGWPALVANPDPDLTAIAALLTKAAAKMKA